MKKTRVPVWVWLILIATHLLALLWSVRTHGWSFPDSDRYLEAAENIRVHGELYARPWPSSSPAGKDIQEYTIRPPGYPLLIAALASPGSAGLLLLLLVQNVASLLSLTVVLRWWAKHARPQTKQWLGAVVLMGAFPAQFIYASAVMSEIPLQAAIMLIACMGIRFLTTDRTRYFIGLCLGCVIALFIKPVFYPMAAVVAVLGLWAAWRRRKRPWLALAGLLPMIAVGLYMHWNMQRTGYFHFSSIAEINLLHYNAAGVMRQVGGPQSEAKWVAAVLHEADLQPTFAERQKLIAARAMDVLWAHPFVYGRQHVQGMILLFLDPGRFDISQFMGLKTPEGGGLLAQSRANGISGALRRLPLELLLLLGALAAANAVRLWLVVRGFVLARKYGPDLRYGRWVVAGLLFYIAGLTGPLGAARFLVPVWPLLLGLALVGWAPPVRREESGTQEAACVREHQG